MAKSPERASRFFTFGSDPSFGSKVVIAWCRIVGWFFTVFFSLGVVLYLVLIPVDLCHAR